MLPHVLRLQLTNSSRQARRAPLALAQHRRPAAASAWLETGARLTAWSACRVQSSYRRRIFAVWMRATWPRTEPWAMADDGVTSGRGRHAYAYIHIHPHHARPMTLPPLDEAVRPWPWLLLVVVVVVSVACFWPCSLDTDWHGHAWEIGDAAPRPSQPAPPPPSPSRRRMRCCGCKRYY